MGMGIRDLVGWVKKVLRSIFKIQSQYIHIKSKEHHITPQFKHLYPNREDEHELVLRLTPIKKGEVPFSYMRRKKRLRVINIEIKNNAD